MEIVVERLFFDNFIKTPELFQRQLMHSYEQIEAAEKLQAVEGVKPIGKSKTDFILHVDRSRIGLKLEGETVVFVCFIYNQFTGY
jgi:hypothetical protein